MSETIGSRRAALEARFPVWEAMTLDRRLDACAAEFSDRPLVITDDRTITYRETADWAARLGDGLAALGVGRGDRVGMLMANYLEFTPLKFAIARAGAVAIPFNFLYRREELAYVLRQSRCNLLITMTGFATLDYPAMLDEIAPGWEQGATEALPDLRAVVQLSTDGREREGVHTVDDLARLGDQHLGAADGQRAEPGDLGDILYTSGTTGSPKGVMVTHDASQRTGYASALTRAFEDGRRILFSLPCYHMFGYVEGLLAAMFVGGAIIPRTAFSPADYYAGIEQHRATEILCVPTMTVALLEHPDRRSRDLSSVFAILSGAAPAPVWLWQKVQDELGITEITTGYGMTECGGAMTMTLPEDPLERHSTTVGRVKLAGAAGRPDHDHNICRYRTVDPVTGEELTAGSEGELASTGPTHMLGFWDKPAETAAALRDGWVFSGDLGRLDDDGYVQITGRSKELYKSGGELVMPKEVEELLTQYPGVSQAYAVGVPDDRWGEAGCVWIVPDAGVELDTEALLAACKEKLARFKVPKHILITTAEELPTTPTGKVQKFKLSQRAAESLA
ncbi:acyl--CoA ligase (plasmid) [Pseudonocardia sp. EC080610-09]|uniref:class I adenylate-forming enzyme family protein n=1 Tax=unclassified Pseudonocardia TaxID=2619320 RepID=UPI00070608A2|nr:MULTISPECIES: AMP-binding protein [unclassified Pseudonocardia]ALL79707.1 acyl--CoA ligase [Pseudonocardia sp. EC080610-09]ALL85676.1 acyl--CoA ligase [Pseudonocardia sp. EC080619-01]